jgi:hypothetical protein
MKNEVIIPTSKHDIEIKFIDELINEMKKNY